MRALLTNDDGVDSPGFVSLVAATLELGWEPVIVVPAKGVSGAGRSRTSGPFSWSECEVLGHRGFKLESTPAACVVMALTSGLLIRPDICLSGVNAGENVGAALAVSGTFGAAQEAAARGVPAIAISRQYGGPIESDPDGWDWSKVARAAKRCVEFCMEHENLRLANVNLVNGRRSVSEPLVATVSRATYFRDRFDPTTGEIHSELDALVGDIEEGDDIHSFSVAKRSVVSFFDDWQY